MRMLRTTLISIVLLIASAAHAERVFDLEGSVTFKGGGQSAKVDVSGSLTLFDDGTYTLDEEGDVSSGIWLEEGTKLQLFQEQPLISEYIAEIEEELSDALGIEISVTSLVEKKTIKRSKTGDLSIKAKETVTVRPTFQVKKALKVTLSVKLVGRLQ